jgi:hypothetical protein
MNDAVRSIMVKEPVSGRTFVVLSIKDYQQLLEAAGYAFHAQSEVVSTVQEACETMAAEVDGERGRTQ